jgi:beta-lactamase regulating signal transducer with metallopeptidase domain
MNALLSALAPYESVARWLLTYLITALWMGAIVTVLAALIVRLVRPLDAGARYAVWYVALIAALLGPLVTTVATQSLAATHVEVFVSQPGGSRAGPLTPASFGHERPRIALPPVAAYGAAALWLLFVLAGTARFVAGVVVLARLKRDALPLSPDRRNALPLWRAHSRSARGRRIRLCVSDRVEVPVAAGLFDGMIVLPQRVLDEFDAADVDRFVLHELAHLERRDDWTTAVQRLAQVALFFNPAVHIIARRLDLEREIACDARVVEATADVRSYAVGLTRMAESTAWPHRRIAASAIFVTRRQLSLRVEEVLAHGRITPHRVAVVPVTLVLAISLGVVGVAMPLAPTIAVAGSQRITEIRKTEVYVLGPNGKRTTVRGAAVFVLKSGDDVQTLFSGRTPGEAAAILNRLATHVNRAELDRLTKSLEVTPR